MAEGGKAGPTPVDLEKELTCSICTDLLYQPLTLLDCLHTFCGACLKEWFAFQASTATSLHPYTCPSCRATVRSTQPNATVTTLLDMFIQANPHRGKSEDEKKADREKFKYGDVVMPKLRKRGGDGGEQEEEERRVLEEVQALSLREVGIEAGNGSSSNNLEPPRERRRRERSRDRRDRSSDTRRSADDRRSRSRNPPTPASREVVPPRVVEHQSSLRSLLSASELDSQEMEEEIMRQIMEEGLLDGIDLNNIDVAQEDEISERIAHAYRRRQADRQRERRERRERLAREGRLDASGHATPPDIRSPPSDVEQRRRPHGRSESGTSTPRDRDNRPPVSRPGLLDVANQGGRTRHHRSSSQGSSRSARSERIESRPGPFAISSNRSANVSSSDLETRPATSGSGTPARRRESDNQQRRTLEERQQFRNSLQTHLSSNPDSPRRAAFNISTTTESPTSSVAVVAAPLASPPVTSPSSPPLQPPTSRRTTDPTGVRQVRPSNSGTPPMTSPPTFPRSTTDPSFGQPRSRPSSVVAAAPPTLYTEPNVTCSGCGKVHIEYELHYNCSRCDNGDFNLCLPCYRRGKGCKHWFGFGWAAWPNYQKRAPKPGGYPPGYEYPHVLRGHRYKRPQAPLTGGPSPQSLVSEDDPAKRLEMGVFCDICKAFANACYWKCDYCNEGDWGYCNDCVNQGKHCTHDLLPITHVKKEQTPTSTTAATDPPSSPRPEHLSPPYPDDSPPTTPPLTPKKASLIRGPGHVTLANSTYRPLTFTTLCNICTYPIPPSHTRFHCSKCNGGDYDVCSPCYQKLVVSGRISKEDGMHGWRRCLRGHRMVVVGFEDRDGGQRRVVVRALVGGLSLKDEVETAEQPSGSPTAPRQKEDKWTWRDTDGSRHHFRTPQSHASPTQPQRYPPDGGVGLRVQARWSYFPAEGVTDELSFPKFAEITEAEDINGDWFWGVYAGAKGLFAGAYGRIIGGNIERVGVI